MAEPWMYQSKHLHPKAPQEGACLDEATGANALSLSALKDSTSPSDSGPGRTLQRIRRRNRQITSCLECRRRKLKCDKQAPCTNCTRFKRDCVYLAPADPKSQAKLADIKEKMGALEKNLEREIVGRGAKAHLGGARITTHNPEDDHTHVGSNDASDEAGEDEDQLEPTPLAALDNTYEDDGDDELMDLGVQMGKMRISERIGGWVRPKLVDELSDTLKDVTAGKSRWSSAPTGKDHGDVSSSANTGSKLLASPKSYIGPGPDYIAPASSFYFPGTNMNTSLLDYLPSKLAADKLVAQYFDAVHIMCRALHRQTFEAQYALYWEQILTGVEPGRSHQAIMFGVMFCAAVSMSETQVPKQFGTSRAALIDSLRSGTEMALAKANFLRTTKVDVMQAYVLYLIPLVRAEVSRAHSALVGTAIRLAECMGLHRDGSYYGMSPVDIHVRRLIWHQLCFLDLRTCEATGPRPQIRPGDYDTRLPLNVDDADLLSKHPATTDRPDWTDATLFRIRAECVELRRGLWFDIIQIDKHKKTLTSAVIKIQKTWNAMTAKYLPMLDEIVPICTLAKHVLTLGVQGCFLQVLHRYLFSAAQRMPDRLRQILIEAGLAQMENAIALETNQTLARWAWYKGAFNQYHSALLLMVEVYAYPMRREAPRIWKCLDYIFDIPQHLSPKQKAELVITDLRDRMEVYHQMRRLKTTTQLEQRINSQLHGKKSALHPSEENASSRQAQNFGPFQLLPVNFSPPAVRTSSVSSNDRSDQPAMSGGDTIMQGLEDIDWAEWDKFFPLESNTGDLNVPDFDLPAYQSEPTMDPYAFAAAAANASGGMVVPTAEELENVTFTPTFYPDMSMRQQPPPH